MCRLQIQAKLSSPWDGESPDAEVSTISLSDKSACSRILQRDHSWAVYVTV